jgi:plastocyanin
MATHNIEITKKAYPTDTKVAAGDTVIWTNRMNMPHTVTADNGDFDSGKFTKDKTFTHVFKTAGAFDYHCEVHSEMQGKVTVT